MSGRFVLYSFDTGSLGHARRTLNVARAISEHCEDSLTLLVGSADFLWARELPRRVDYLRLPALTRERFDRPNYVSSQWGDCGPWFWDMRAHVLRDVLVDVQPDAILVDYKAPGVNGELVAGLRAAAAGPARVICGLRDWPDSPQRTIAKWKRDGTYDLLDSVYDEIVVYGNPEVFDTASHLRLPPDRTSYAGYVLPPPLVHERKPTEEARVLVTGGSGRYLGQLLDLVLAAHETIPPDERPILEILPGPYADADIAARLAAITDPSVRISPATADARERMLGARLVVSQGGYNTLTEALSLGKRPLVLPRMPAPGADINLEQQERTLRFAQLGLVDALPVGDAGVRTLSTALRTSTPAPAPNPEALQLIRQDGASWLARHLCR